jgi:AraC-like DNA-binding protein
MSIGWRNSPRSRKVEHVVNPEAERVRIEAAGAAPDEAVATLSGFYDGSEWSTRTTGRAYGFRYAALGDGAMTLRTSRMSGYLNGVVPPTGDVVVQWIVGGSAAFGVGGPDLAMQRGRPMLFPAHEPFEFEFADYDQRLVHLDRAAVLAVTEERYGIAPDAVRFDHRRPASAAAAATFLDTVGLAGRIIRRQAPSELLWHELTRLTIAGFLELYPPAVAAPEDAARSSSALRVRQVVEHIHAHAALPLTPAGLARVADVSVRTLQETFQRHVGTTPMAYVRQVRLDRAREALLAAVPGTVTVADVARSWGFAHLGRFSAEYRRRFGERPSDTLRG